MALKVYLFSWLWGLLFTLVEAQPIQNSQEAVKIFSQSKTWRSYLQFYPQQKSRIDAGSKFFLSPTGDHDALSELTTSLRAIVKNRDQFACQFPARYNLLQAEFHLPVLTTLCPAVEKFNKTYSHQRVQIVFAGQYGSSPGSIMGHTLLKFADDDKADFLNYTFGYMADVPDSVGGLEYSYKGILGGFKGYFVVGPYYEKVFEYNNIENRDIWEYELNFTAQQKNFLIQYIYELQNSAVISYFFAGRNCAYVLLAALQAVRPDKNLLEQMHFYVLPVETVKILKDQDLIEAVHFRPSQKKILTDRLARLTDSQKDEFNHGISNKIPSPTDDVAVIEAQMDYVNFLRLQFEGQLPREWVEFEKNLLIKRSQLQSLPKVPIETPPDVLQGHGPFRFAAFAGTQFGFELRPGVHSQLEKSVGYLPRSSLDFLVTEFSKNSDQDWKLSRIIFADFALTPEFTLFFPQWTWQLKWQWNNSIPGYCNDCNVQSIEYQMGLTLDLEHSVRWGILADDVAEQSNFFKDHYRLGIGPMTFLQYNVPAVGQLQLSCKYLGADRSIFSGDGRIYDIFPHVSLEYGASLFTDSNKKWQSEHRLGLSYDFSW